jgi:hypothetical protein
VSWLTAAGLSQYRRHQKQLRIEYHPAPDRDAAKTPDDVVAVDLSTRTLVASQV